MRVYVIALCLTVCFLAVIAMFVSVVTEGMPSELWPAVLVGLLAGAGGATGIWHIVNVVVVIKKQRNIPDDSGYHSI